jgi:dGTPase
MSREDRINTPEERPPDETRDSAQRDRDRILYSSAFRRLGGVTQVVSASEGLIIHNRLTHTVKVAQVARRLAERLVLKTPSRVLKAIGGVNPETAEAAALAHDIGHPPFGHISEEILDYAAQNSIGPLPDGFEGNPQSFRIVVRQSVRTAGYAGLNLTRGTLNAILKYPWLRDEGPRDKDTHRKWGAYQEDRDAFDFARAESQGFAKSPEAEIMDWADDIAYALHDTEDFYRAGLIPMDRLVPGKDEREWRRFLDFYCIKKNFVTEAAKSQADRDLQNAIGPVGPQEPFVGSMTQRYFLRSWVSNRVGAYIAQLRLKKPDAKGEVVEIEETAKRELDLLKNLTWYYVINSPALAAQQHGQRLIIRRLFRIFRSAARFGRYEILPSDFADRVKTIRGLTTVHEEDQERRITRLIVDLIAAMTETQALKVYQKLVGIDPGSAMDQILHQSLG